MTSVVVQAEYIGSYDQSGFYRVDLSQIGLASIRSFTIFDDNQIHAGTGAASGFDLDSVVISTTSATTAAAARIVAGEDVFDFSTAGTIFQAGFVTPWFEGSDPPEWNADLTGTIGNTIYDPDKATLGTPDAWPGWNYETGTLSLGEGGRVTFNLKTSVDPTGRYLYIADADNVPDPFNLVISDTPGVPVMSGLTLNGRSIDETMRSIDDTIQLGVGRNSHLGAGSDWVNGRQGDDRIYTGGGNDTLLGDVGADWLFGQSGNDALYGGADRDYLFGDQGIDSLYGEAGADQLYGGGDGDVLYAGADGDYLSGDQGFDSLYGEAGADQLYGGGDGDLLFGGTEGDDLFGDQGIDWLYGDAGDDRLYGGADGDVLYGGAGADLMYGGLGNDTYYVDSFFDRILESRGQGLDRIFTSTHFALAASSEVEVLATSTALKINLTGSNSAQSILGNAAANILRGLAGNDKIYGYAGNDKIGGGAGLDVLSGGLGRDSFVFDTAPNTRSNADRITDFSARDDVFLLDNKYLKTVGQNGSLKSDAFHIGKTAADAQDRVVYDRTTGNLFYDGDGTGGLSPIKLATLTNKAHLGLSDFLVI